MDKEWWLEKGVIVEHAKTGVIGKIIKIQQASITDDLYEGELVIQYGVSRDCLSRITNKYKLRGVPFDCIPEWATYIRFASIHCPSQFQFINKEHNSFGGWIDFPKCPEAFKGNSYPITEKLRNLINKG